MNQPQENWPDPSGPTALPGRAGAAGATDDPNLPDQALAAENAAVERQVERRLASSTFSSGLSVAGYGACLELGMEPVGLVQGFCAMRYVSYGSDYWNYFRSNSNRGFYRQWDCPHGYTKCPRGYPSSDYRRFGYNAEMLINEQSWMNGYSAAYNRMLNEAREAGAHGIIGVTHSFRTLIDSNIMEFHLTGTAVRIGNLPKPATPFSTFLAGQKLVKLIEAGYMPVSIVASVAEIAVYAYCRTETLLSGTYVTRQRGGGSSSGVTGAGGATAQAGSQSTGRIELVGWRRNYPLIEIEQVLEAYLSAYQIAEEGAARQLAGDSLHGASMSFSTYEMGEADRIVTCFLQGNRVRRFADPEPLPAPKAVVGLWD
jgi:hypothetical protein